MSHLKEKDTDIVKQVLGRFLTNVNMGEAQYQQGMLQTQAQAGYQPDTSTGDIKREFRETDVLGELGSRDYVVSISLLS